MKRQQASKRSSSCTSTLSPKLCLYFNKYSQLSPRRATSGPTPTVRLREVSVWSGYPDTSTSETVMMNPVSFSSDSMFVWLSECLHYLYIKYATNIILSLYVIKERCSMVYPNLSNVVRIQSLFMLLVIWQKSPDHRPSFQELHVILQEILQELGGSLGREVKRTYTNAYPLNEYWEQTDSKRLL